MSIHDWPSADRPREKLLAAGEHTLTDAELIAIFLKTGVKGKSALDLAKELLVEFGGLKPLLKATPEQLLCKPGLGAAKLAALKAAKELGKRYLATPLLRGQSLKSSILTRKFIAERLGDYAQEMFACLFLDTKLRLLSFEILFQGTLNEATVYPREIVKRGLALNAASIILAHNHPSGNPEPSEADKASTRQIQLALDLVGIKLVDHIIIGHPYHFSFAEYGLLTPCL